MNRLKIAAAATLLAGAACTAHAQDDIARLGGDQPPPRAAPNRQSIFLSPAGEPFRVRPGQPYPAAAWFARVDANHDGQISREELRADFEQFFKTLDENHDGVIDSFEIDDYEHKIAPEVLSVLERAPEARADQASDGQGGEGQGGRGGSSGGPGGGAGGSGRERRGGGQGGPGGAAGGAQNAQNAAMARLQVQGAAAYSLLSISEPVAAADMDLDGKISLAEFRAAADRRFDLLDPKHLGYLTLDTLPKTPAQIAEAKQAKARASGGPPQGGPPGGPPPMP